MSCKKWVILFLSFVALALILVGVTIIVVDPLFHYHAPAVDKFYYSLYEERYVNDGIAKHFDYDAVITGTSMTEKFKSSEFDELFDVNSVKVPFAGASVRETNNILKVAYKSGHKLKAVIKSIDQYRIMFEDTDWINDEQGTCPEYLYDNNIFNDVNYVFNKSVLFKRVIKFWGHEPGITSFDDYAATSDSLLEDKTSKIEKTDELIKKNQEPLGEKAKKNLIQTVKQNVVQIAIDHPETTFYYFIPGYSILEWEDWYKLGAVSKAIDAVKIISELCSPVKNIKLYCFYNDFDLVSDISNYSDTVHYHSDINSYILESMKNEKFLITDKNRNEIINDLLDFYLNYDY